MKARFEIKEISDLILRHERTTLKVINVKCRDRELVFLRQLCMSLCKEFTRASLATIGAYFGNRDHATVLHAVKTINNLCETDRQIKMKVNGYRKMIEELPDWHSPIVKCDIPITLFKKIARYVVLTPKELSALAIDCPDTAKLYRDTIRQFGPVNPQQRFLPKKRR